jgi:hypothetical protein
MSKKAPNRIRVAGYSYLKKVPGHRSVRVKVKAYWREVWAKPVKPTKPVKQPSKSIRKARIRKVKAAVRRLKQLNLTRPLKERRKRTRATVTPRVSAEHLTSAEKADKKAESWRERIKSALDRTIELTGYQGRSLVVRNADGSVDGELRLLVPPKTHERYLIIKLSEVAIIPQGAWMSLGCRYAPDALQDKDRDRYVTWRGMTDVATHYGSVRFRGDYFASAVKLADDMRDTATHKAREVVLRINFNGDHERPERKGK